MLKSEVIVYAIVGFLFQRIVFYIGREVFQAVSLAYQADLSRIPGPRLSRFSNLPLKIQALTGNRNTYIDGLHKKYGKFVRVAPNEVSVSDIAAYREIHKVGTKFTKAPWYQKLSPKQYDDETCAVFGIRDHQKAAARRKLFLQAGNPATVREWEPQITKIVDLTVKRIREDLDENGKADIMKWWSYMTTDILGLIAFGESFDMVMTGQKPKLVKDIETSIILVGLKLELPWIWTFLELLPVPSFKKFVGLFDRFEEYADTAITNTRLAAKRDTKTLFSKMVNADGEALPEQVIRQEAVNILIAGVDSTAMTLTYLTYGVLADETGDIKRRLLAELDTCSSEPTWAELEKLGYLNHIVDETLRLYTPIGGSLPRVPPAEGAILGTYKLPPDTLVLTQSSTYHTVADVFEKPLEFKPERWENASASMKESYMPFGGSSRFCLGQTIARLEILQAVARLFKESPDIRLVSETNKQSMKPLEFFVNKPRGMKCEIERSK